MSPPRGGWGPGHPGSAAGFFVRWRFGIAPDVRSPCASVYELVTLGELRLADPRHDTGTGIGAAERAGGRAKGVDACGGFGSEQDLGFIS